MRPTVAEIRLAALRQNLSLLEANVHKHAGLRALVLPVIKADAYGHGAALCARALVEGRAGDEGEQWLGVTTVEEALELRRALGQRRPRLLVMSGFFPGEEGQVLQHHLTPQVWEGWHLQLLDAAARRIGLPPRSVPVHLEMDTGMSRQGVAPGEALATLLRSAGCERDSPLAIEGVLTHFSSPEVLESPVMAEQVRRFKGALEQLRAVGIRPRWIHAGNSANALAGGMLGELAELARGNGATLMVRPGLALYGVPTRFTPELAADRTVALERLEPVLQWRSEITSIRMVGAGATAGYNETFHAGAEGARLALLPVGYADGLRRELSGRGAVLVRGQRAPIAGRISMDQTIVDVSGVPEAGMGDPVVLLGAQGSEQMTAQEHADLCGTIPYEVLCGISKRVPRVAV